MSAFRTVAATDDGVDVANEPVANPGTGDTPAVDVERFREPIAGGAGSNVQRTASEKACRVCGQFLHGGALSCLVALLAMDGVVLGPSRGARTGISMHGGDLVSCEPLAGTPGALLAAPPSDADARTSLAIAIVLAVSQFSAWLGALACITVPESWGAARARAIAYVFLAAAATAAVFAVVLAILTGSASGQSDVGSRATVAGGFVLLAMAAVCDVSAVVVGLVFACSGGRPNEQGGGGGVVEEMHSTQRTRRGGAARLLLVSTAVALVVAGLASPAYVSAWPAAARLTNGTSTTPDCRVGPLRACCYEPGAATPVPVPSSIEPLVGCTIGVLAALMLLVTFETRPAVINAVGCCAAAALGWAAFGVLLGEETSTVEASAQALSLLMLGAAGPTLGLLLPVVTAAVRRPR